MAGQISETDQIKQVRAVFVSGAFEYLVLLCHIE